MDLILNFVVCGNSETTGNCGEFGDDVCADWTRDVADGLGRLPFAHDGTVRVNNHFPDWHGGKYAHQSKQYGYESFGHAVCTGGTREVPVTDGDEGETEEVTVKWADLSAEERAEVESAVWAVIEAADLTRKAAQAEDDAESEARYAAAKAEAAD